MGWRRVVRLMPIVAALTWAVALMHTLPAWAEPKAHSTRMANDEHASCCTRDMGTSAAILGTNPASPPLPGHGSHQLTDLCLAVLNGLAAVALGLILARLRRAGLARDSSRLGAGRTAPARAPPRPAGRALLNVVCVQRT